MIKHITSPYYITAIILTSLLYLAVVNKPKNLAHARSVDRYRISKSKAEVRKDRMLRYIKVIPAVEGKDAIVKEVHRLSNKYDVDPLLTMAIITKESNFNTHAKNPKSSARGLMQVLRGTAKGHCKITEPDFLYNPTVGIDCGLKVLTDYMAIARGNIRKSLAIYYCGEGMLRKNPKPCYSYAKDVERIYTRL